MKGNTRTYAERKQYMLWWQQENHKNIVKEYEQYKRDHPCKDCGYSGNIDALEFDHLDGNEKTCNVSALTFRSKKMLYREISKCDVVCANCHRIRTAKRFREKNIIINKPEISKPILFKPWGKKKC